MANRLEWDILKKTCGAIQDRLHLQSPRHGFFHFVMAPLLGLTAAEIEDSITDGTGDRGIDAFYFDERQGTLQLHIFNFKYVNEFENSSSAFSGNEIDKVLTFLDDFVGQKPTLLKQCNALLAPKIEYVWQKFQSPIFRITIHLCSNAAKLLPHERKRLDIGVMANHFASVIEHDIDAVVTNFLRARDQICSGSVRMLDRQFFERTDGSVRGLIVTVSARELISLICDPKNPSAINRSIFNENIRMYLGAKNFVNRQIISSATGNSKNDFWYLNNGITIICDGYRFNPGIPGAQIDLDNFQIVNGGQTANAIFEVGHGNPSLLNSVSILVRIYETKRSDFKPVVAATTNNQSRIDSRDLRSNDEKQRKIEAGMEAEGYFYERKVDQHADKPEVRRVDALRAGQAYLAYFRHLPDRARTQSDKIFGEWYENIFDDDVTHQQLLTAFRILQLIDEKKRLTKSQLRSGISRDQVDEFLIEGIFHVLYVVGQICLRDRIDLDDFSRASKKIDDAINLTRIEAVKYKSKSFYRFFRSVEAREILFKSVHGIAHSGDQLLLTLD